MWTVRCYFRRCIPGRAGLRGRTGVSVTVVDPRTGKSESMETAPFGTPESERFWKLALDQLRARLNRRGIADDRIMIGIAMDLRPGKTVTDFFHKIAPYAKWVLQAHAGPDKIGVADVGYMTHVWNVRSVPDQNSLR